MFRPCVRSCDTCPICCSLPAFCASRTAGDAWGPGDFFPRRPRDDDGGGGRARPDDRDDAGARRDRVGQPRPGGACARSRSVVAGRLRELGGDVELVTHDDPYRMVDTPAELGPTVVGRFRGRGSGRILLLAHMDTVYRRGQLAEQPFRIYRRTGLRPGHRGRQERHRADPPCAGVRCASSTSTTTS